MPLCEHLNEEVSINIPKIFYLKNKSNLYMNSNGYIGVNNLLNLVTTCNFMQLMSLTLF